MNDSSRAESEGDEAPSISTRQASLAPKDRAFHRHILHEFLRTGEPPYRDELHASGTDTHEALRRLSEIDLVHLGANGRVTVAYPFSAAPTGHVVHLDDRPAVHAMCAIDALGIPLMANRDGVVTSTDPTTKRPVRVEFRQGEWVWEPSETVVLLGHTADQGTSADCTCPVITFHTHAAHARTHLLHTAAQGAVLNQVQAIEEAHCEFANLLAT